MSLSSIGPHRALLSQLQDRPHGGGTVFIENGRCGIRNAFFNGQYFNETQDQDQYVRFAAFCLETELDAAIQNRTTKD